MTAEDGLLAGEWKYIVNWDRRARLLYNLSEDPGELRNLIGQRPDTVRVLHDLLADQLSRQLAYYEQRLWERDRYIAPLP